jgi:hypothetical protein
MDILWFLRRRLSFVANLYDTATAPFETTKGKIEAGEPPFVDQRDLERFDVSEPPFLEEFLEANESAEVIGHWCLCMVQASLKAFLEEYVENMERDYGRALGDLRAKLSAKKAKSWFERYRLLFGEELDIDWHKGPVPMTDLEQINLTRDDLIHNVDMATTYVYQTEKHAEHYPKSLFTDEVWMKMGLGGKIVIKKDQLTKAVALVENFCAWLEEIRVRYPAYVRSPAEH